MGSKKLLAVILVALVGVPALADARLSKDLKKELQGYVDKHVESDSPQAKEAALLTQGRIGGRTSRKALAEYKEAEKDRVKLGAGMGLWFAGDRRADDFLVEQLADDKQLYLTLREVVTVLPDDKEEKLIERVIKKADAGRKRDAMRYLAQQHGDLYEVLGQYLTGRDDETRKAAIQAALFTARPEAGEYAKKMVDSRRSKVRADGVDFAIALTRQPGESKKAVEALEDALGDKSDEIRTKATRHLVTLGHDKAAEKLAATIAKAEEPEQKKEIATFLLENDAEVSYEVAKPLLEAEDAELKALGWQLAAASGNEEVVGKLRKMFGSTKFDERVVAVEAMGRTEDPAVVGMLGKALFEGNPEMRLQAARSLGRLESDKGLVFLQKAIGGERDPKVKIAVIDAVASIDSPKSVNLLRFQTTSRNPEVKLAVVRGLRKLGKKEGAKALGVLMQDRDLKVQWNSFLTALELDPKKGLAMKKNALRNPPDAFMADIEQLDEDVRNQLVEYLLVHGSDESRAAALSTARKLETSMLPTYRKLVVDAQTPDNVRRELLMALAEKRADKDKPLFEKLATKSADENVRRMAAWTLTEYATEDLEATFRGMLGHDDDVLKSIAAYGIAAIND